MPIFHRTKRLITVAIALTMFGGIPAPATSIAQPSGATIPGSTRPDGLAVTPGTKVGLIDSAQDAERLRVAEIAYALPGVERTQIKVDRRYTYRVDSARYDSGHIGAQALDEVTFDQCLEQFDRVHSGWGVTCEVGLA